MNDQPDLEQTRVEHDTMGEVLVPRNALYGAQTQRAVDNFPISDLRLQRPFIEALGLIKASAAKVNGELGAMDPALAAAIETAANAVVRGDHDDQFVVDVYQTGSGTSTNMNANEVIAHLVQKAGHKVHANDDVNRSQSSNDVFPTAIHVSAAVQIHRELFPAMAQLKNALADRAAAFQDVIKIGRTHLQDAVPMRLGQEFSGYVQQVESAQERIEASLRWIYELALGGTAVGTGLNAPADFAPKVIAELAARTGLRFREAQNHFEAQASKDAVCFLSGALRTYAIAVTKIANDIRWLASGPRCGLGELLLPEIQPGSSIMPGKVNPVIAESALMACAQVIGHDAAITWACASGNFELNMMMPLIAYNLLDSIHLLSTTSANLASRCILGLTADVDRNAYFAEQSLSNVTALVPEIGYERAAAIAKEAHRSKRTIREVAKEQSGLSDEQLSALLDPVTQAGSS